MTTLGVPTAAMIGIVKKSAAVGRMVAQMLVPGFVTVCVVKTKGDQEGEGGPSEVTKKPGGG